MGYSHRKKWTQELIEEDILRVVDSLGLKHFPTHSEMVSFYGNTALTNKIAKTGGTRSWAQKLGLPTKRCESELGNDFEILAIKDIEKNTGLQSHLTKTKFPYDLLTGNGIKVDVKVSYPATSKTGVLVNTFNLGKKDPTCDLFILYCLKKDGSIYKTLIIPSCVVKGKTQLGVGFLSKWDFFNEKWHYLESFWDFNESIITNVELPGKRRSKKIAW